MSDYIPQVTVNDNPVSNWVDKVNKAHRHGKIESKTSDITVRETSNGTVIGLNRRNEMTYDAGNMIYKSEYAYNSSYNVGEVVRVLPGKTYTVDSGSTLSSSWIGTYVCVQYVPSKDFTDNYVGDRTADAQWLRQSNVHYFPQLPEPNASNLYWVPFVTGSSTDCRMFTINSVISGSDYFVALDTATTASVNIAKQVAWRTTTATDNIDGVPLTYNYSDTNHRVASDGNGNSQNENLYPRLVVNQTIFAMKSSNGTGVAGADWIEITPRVWVRRRSG
jgi:hypothetical protein